MKAFTIQQGSKTIGIRHNEHHYVVGFASAVMARRVQYQLHPDPVITFFRNDESTIFIPKFCGSAMDPMNDGGYHLGQQDYNKFITFPFTKSVGVILPYHLIEESEEEFIFRCHVLDPFYSRYFAPQE